MPCAAWPSAPPATANRFPAAIIIQSSYSSSLPTTVFGETATSARDGLEVRRWPKEDVGRNCLFGYGLSMGHMRLAAISLAYAMCGGCVSSAPSAADVEAALAQFYDPTPGWSLSSVETDAFRSSKLLTIDTCDRVGVIFICNVVFEDGNGTHRQAQLEMIPTPSPSRWVTSGPTPRP